MLAARQQAGCLSRQMQHSIRRYAHSHRAARAAPVNESFGKGSIITVSIFFGSVLFYQFVPKQGEESAITNFIAKYLSRPQDWEEITALHVRAMEQAGFDRNLFENASNKHRFVDVPYPEALQSHGARNIQAGQIRNIDDVVEHYRQKHLKEEERKAQKLAMQQQRNASVQ